MFLNEIPTNLCLRNTYTSYKKLKAKYECNVLTKNL